MADDLKRDVVPFGTLTVHQLKTLWGNSLEHLEHLSERPLARVYVANTPVEADYLMGILKQEGIPALLQSHRDTAFTNLFEPIRGAAAIITLQEDAYRALNLIESVLDIISKQGGLPDDVEVTENEEIPSDDK